MKKYLPMLLLSSLAISVSSTVIAAPSRHAPVNQNAIVTSKGAMFEIRLESNPTTGYSWKYTLPGNSVVKYVSKTFVSDNHPEGMVGVGGTEVYKFQAVKAGKSQIKFDYLRPWEKNTPAIESKTYNITVK